MSAPATIQRGVWGLSWTLTDEPMRRTSHALAAGGRVWLVDPVDDDAAIAAAGELGTITGVVQLLDRHNRDAAALADRLGVEHLRLPDAIPDSPFVLRRMLWLPVWKEQAIWWDEHRLLVAAEAVGTIPYFAVHGGPVGVHPFLRARPPRLLTAYEPDALLCGHGDAVTTGAGAALHEALRRSRRDIPRAAVALVKAFAPGRG